MKARRTVAGKYVLGALIGKGGSGEVYRALQIDLDREVAVKLLAGARGDEDARVRFLHEARIGADIHHPCVAQVFDAGLAEDGTPYFAMELLEGQTLGHRIDRGGPLDVREAVAIVAGLCLGLQAVHAKGFLHRDIKPSNVFLARRPDGGADPKLIDFGIAKRIAVTAETRRRLTTARGLGPAAATALDLIVGTPRYLSPEQVLGEKLTERTDVYALAVTLYEAIAGETPFDVEEFSKLAQSIVLDPPPPLAQRAPERKVPAALDRAILRALSKKPADRPASAADFATSLWAALAEARHTPDALPSPLPSPWRRRALAIAVAAAALLTLAIVGLRPAPPPAAPPAPPAVIATQAPAPTPDPPAAEPAVAAPATATSARAAPRANAMRPPRPTAAAPPPATSAPPVTTAAARYRIDDLKAPY